MKRASLFIFLFFFQLAYAQVNRKIALLDMTALNAETNSSRLYSVNRMLRSAGIAYDVTYSLDTALQYPLVIMGSRINNGAFNSTQVSQITSYVNNGGILITSCMRDSALFNLCGISGYNSYTNVYSITWDTVAQPEIFWQVDDSLEINISLGDTSFLPNITMRGYVLTTGSSLGGYENGQPALVKNSFGNGFVYSFGPDFRDVYLRNQLDFDNNAHRTYSNGFEPTSDVIMFIVRNIYRYHLPNPVYKYTSLKNSSSTVMITHDIDSETGVDTMSVFSSMENGRNIVAQYNVTTRYFNDAWLTAFYIGSWSEVNQLITDGHVISSHSVGHFPDFDNETIFPYGSLGNTAASYQPYYSSGVTSGGTLLGELEVSKNLLAEDHGVSIRSFRSGHLAYHDLMAIGLEQLGYDFNSTHSANNVLTGFPFYDFYDRSFSSTESGILELPMTLSDVFSADPITQANYLSKVDIWNRATRQYEANNAPVIILIHPNRMYKLDAEERYLDSLSPNIAVANMEYFGDFWRKRDSLLYHTEISGDSLLVFFENNVLNINQSFVVDTTHVQTVLFYDWLMQPVDFISQPFSGSSLLYYQQPNTASIVENEAFKCNLYPNPTTNAVNVHVDHALEAVQVEVTHLSGAVVYTATLQADTKTFIIPLHQLSIPNGVYIVSIKSSDSNIYKKVIYQGSN